jgi:[glutamine synthetase] adenylyltransferase / [glutamine synthetase]-adenylyl-L-tyrosine phosphorylase
MRPEFSSLSFRDPGKAEGNLARLTQQLAPSLMTPLASLLVQSPDPDGALNLLERYAQAAPAEVLQELPRYPAALTYLVAIFGYSSFLAETFLSEPGLAIQFARDRNFTRLKSKEDLMQDYARFATTNPDPWLSAQLARFKRRNYLRIVLKDVLGISTVGEVTLELSALADVILSNALAFCDQELEKRYGQPQYRDAQGRIVRCGFSVVSLGKLGGNELNYSSDIDLLFLYSQDGETAGASERDSVITNKEYAVHQAHAITRTVAQATPQGQVFRVDLRLRPEGEQGDAAISLGAALEYYKRRAREWELQMLIKARHSAGDAQLAREFIRGVAPHIYGSPADFETVESVLWAREKISKRLRESRGGAVDVKRHRGGIRDIEFLAQCLQRLQGGHDPWVRSGGTLLALRKLNDKGWLSDSDFAALTSCYEFCRKVEHRIQLEHGQQTHRLPTEREALGRLARRVGVAHGPSEEPGQALLRRLREGFVRVDEIYQRAVHPPLAATAGISFALEPSLLGSVEPGFGSYEATLAYLDVQSPALARLLREVSLPERSRKNGTRFFASLLSSSERFRQAQLEPQRVRRALEITGASEYFAELLIHHPDDLVVLDFPESPLPAPPPEVEAAQMEIGLEKPGGLEPFPWVNEASLDTREKRALLRRQYRTRVLELGAADLAGLGSVFSALRRWSSLAARSISSALCIAAQALNTGPGDGASGSTPEASGPKAGPGKAGLSPCGADFPLVVLGLGRLGLNEFDLASDADLVFVVAAGAAREETALWTRLVEKTIEVLSSYTRDGTLFSVDTRLRPRGQAGELVISENALLSYFSETAQAWEVLTYLKASPVAGNFGLGRRVISSLVGDHGDLFKRSAAYTDLAGEIHQMRRRVEREVAVPPSNTKTAPGGYYDVDFAVSFLRLRHAVSLPPGANIAEQVAALARAGLVTDEDSRTLTQGAAFLRSLDHAVRLVTGKPASGLPEHVGHAEAVENLARRWGLLTGTESLARRLRDTQQQVRYVYRRLVGSE